MNNFNSYWPIYKNLEDEILQLAKYIQFSDDQLNVYSMYIADLITRIVIEIESLSKDLYKANSGPDVFDDNGNSRTLYFDTDCINYLNNIWEICNRDVLISCSSFNITNKNFKPLHKANKRGTSSAKWNIAYQAVKHDRRNNLEKGNIRNLIQALGALYILNVYYRDDIFEYQTLNNSNSFFDNRLGSDIFSVSFVDASKTSIGDDDSDMSIIEEERKKISSAIYIIKYTDKTWEDIHDELKKYNNEIISEIIQNPKFIQKLNEKITSLNISNNDVLNTVQDLIKEMQVDQIRKKPPIHFGRMITNGKKEIVLNKNQTIYR